MAGAFPPFTVRLSVRGDKRVKASLQCSYKLPSTPLSMHARAQRIREFAYPGLVWTLNGGLSEGELARLEREMGLGLPYGLRASFRVHNGQAYHADPVSARALVMQGS
jgi:cell wall assembly regulator SMI1